MKNRKIWTAVAALALLASSAPARAKNFEGELRYRMTSSQSKEPADLSYWIKGDRIRYEWRSESKKGAAAGIIDGRKKKVFVLMPEQKMYMEWPMESMRKEAAEAESGERKRPDLKRTGRTDTILGYRCEEWRLDDEDGSTEIWATRELGSFLGFGSRGREEAPPWEKDAATRGLFPLKVLHHDPKGKETMTMVATKIDKKTVPDSSFAVPAGYKKMEMPNMGDMKSGAKEESKREMKRSMKEMMLRKLKPF